MRIIGQKDEAKAENQYKNYVYYFTIEHIDFLFDTRMMFIDTYTIPFNLSIIYVDDSSVNHPFFYSE